MKKSRLMAVLLFVLVLAVALPATAQSQGSGTRQSANVNALSLEEGLLGKSIRTQAGEDVGEIEDVIFSKRGRISHVLVDVGGFLGMGEKTVALNLNQLRFGNQDYALFNGTRNDLENMPEVDLYAFRRPYRGYYGPYGGYGPYAYGPYYGSRGYAPHYGPRAYGPYAGPYGGGAMQQGQRDQGQEQWQGRGSQQQDRQYYQDSRQGRAGMRQDRGMMRQDRGMMQQDQMQGRMMSRGMSGDLFLGAQVVNQWNDNLGEVEDLIIDPSTGRITHAVIEVGGFWDIGDRHVVVPYNRLRQLDPYYVLYRGTEEQLEQMPEYQRGEGGRVTGLERQQQTQRAGGQGGDQSATQQRQYSPQSQQQPQRKGGSQSRQ